MHNKVALVTGSSRGIGRAIALELASCGYDICVNYLSDNVDAEDVCNKIRSMNRRAICVQADVGKTKDLKSLFNQIDTEYGRIDLLVNNAGVTKYLPLLECTEELWEEITNTDWKGAFFATQYAAKRMVSQATGGVILNITSIHQTCNFPISNVYGPTKAALNKFTKHAALELAKYGIRVISIAPGCIKIREGEDETPRGKRLKSRIPFGRYGSCEEIAKAAAWLASDDASYITGTCLMLDGGGTLPVLLDNTFVPDDPGGRMET